MEKKILLNGRKQVSTRTRFEIFKRDLFTCQYCGATPPGVLLHIDHIIAVANGGGNDRDNLVTACQGCNLGKSAVALTSVPRSLKDKSKEVAEREKQIHGYNAILQAKRDRIESEAWAIAAALERMEYVDSYNRRGLVSIRMFLERLPYQEVLDAVDVTVSRWDRSGSRAFRYFCAVCWNKIKESQNGSD